MNNQSQDIKKWFVKVILMNVKLFIIILEKKIIAFTEKEENTLLTTLYDNYPLEAIFQLQKKYKTIMFLYYYENYKIKEISTDAIKVKENLESPKMTFKEVEEMLKFSILKLPENNTNDIYYRTSLNDNGSIGRVDLWILYFYKENENKYISVSVNIFNKYADERYILVFQEGIDAMGEKNIENSYKSENLNTNIVVYTNDWSEERLTATFVYDDILYQFIGHNILKDEMTSIMETLK